MNVPTEPAKRHTLHVLGCLGIKHAYLDMPLEEARRRYIEVEGDLPEEWVISFEFDDEFSVYDAWS